MLTISISDMSNESTNETAKILNHHLSAFAKGDIDEILKDYSEQSVLFTPDGTFEGLENLKKLFTDFITNVMPTGTSFKMIRQEVKENTAYIVWSAESENYRLPLGTDTIFTKDGKITVQTFAGVIEPKK